MDNKKLLQDLITLNGKSVEKEDHIINLYEISEIFGLDLKSSKTKMRINDLTLSTKLSDLVLNIRKESA